MFSKPRKKEKGVEVEQGRKEFRGASTKVSMAATFRLLLGCFALFVLESFPGHVNAQGILFDIGGNDSGPCDTVGDIFSSER